MWLVYSYLANKIITCLECFRKEKFCERKVIDMYIFRASKKLKDGTVIYARDYGLRGFPIWIGPGPEPEKPKKK